MKQNFTIFLALALVALTSVAQEPAASAGPKVVTTNPDEEAWAGLIKSEMEFNAQYRLLTSLSQEHRKRASEATAAKQNDKAVWESELAKELGDKAAATLNQVTELNKQRRAFEQSHTNALSIVILNAVSGGSRLNPYEAEFMSRVDERLRSVDQDLLAARQDATTYASQIHTNTNPVDISYATAVLDQKSRLVRDLQNEQFELELKRLEFQALRRH